MLFLRTLLIFVLGISVVAAIPVSPMTSSIHRRGDHLQSIKKKLGMEPKPLPRPATEDEAKQRINGLWSVAVSVKGESSLNLIGDVYVKIANGEFVGLWPEVESVSKYLEANRIEGLRRVQNIESLKQKANLPSTMTEGVENTQPQFRNDALSIWFPGNVYNHSCTKEQLAGGIGVIGGSPPYHLCVPIKDQRLRHELGI